MNKTQEKFAYKLNAYILANPKKVLMNYFQLDTKFVSPNLIGELDCGTVGCIAGSAEFLANGSWTSNAPVDATVLLGITHEEGEDLFYFPWQLSNKTRYRRYAKQIKDLTPGTDAYAAVVAAALQHCINFKVKQREKKG